MGHTAAGRLSGKVAIISGAARGMGASHARRFVAEGASVMLTDISRDGEGVALSLGEKAAFERHDVSSSEDWMRVVAATEARFGPVSVLVNNAGIVVDGEVEGPIESIDEEVFHKTVAVNQFGTFLGMKCVVPSMRRAGGGSIVNISSAAGMAPVPYLLSYVASKWAVIGMTKTAALEFGRYKIRVNSVAPGSIWTPIHIAGPTEEDALEARRIIDGQTASLPIGRVGQPEEVSNLVAYLASDESSYSTGGEFVVDGGWLLAPSQIVDQREEGPDSIHGTYASMRERGQ